VKGINNKGGYVGRREQGRLNLFGPKPQEILSGKREQKGARFRKGVWTRQGPQEKGGKDIWSSMSALGLFILQNRDRTEGGDSHGGIKISKQKMLNDWVEKKKPKSAQIACPDPRGEGDKWLKKVGLLLV